MTKAQHDQCRLQMVAAYEGFPNVQTMLENAVTDCIVPGLCLHCSHIQSCEPDARKNWCEECGENTVRSVLVMAGLI